MYLGWSPFLRTKFWKKEFVGRGVDSRFGEKNLEGSGRRVESACGNRKGVLLLVLVLDIAANDSLVMKVLIGKTRIYSVCYYIINKHWNLNKY
jgi:hypothetical protein